MNHKDKQGLRDKTLGFRTVQARGQDGRIERVTVSLPGSNEAPQTFTNWKEAALEILRLCEEAEKNDDWVVEFVQGFGQTARRECYSVAQLNRLSGYTFLSDFEEALGAVQRELMVILGEIREHHDGDYDGFHQEAWDYCKERLHLTEVLENE